jgi:serine/threonine-protein kinase
LEENRKNDRAPKIDDLEAGLAAAFGPASRFGARSASGGNKGPSVLRVIERITGDAPRILLRDADSEHDPSPVIDASSSEKRSIPQGRGSYQILGEIARGGMGVVMKGHDTDLGRDVAMKVLHRDLAERPEVLQRFVEEAQIGGQLQHPGIVPVYELGLMADERPYFTMKLVKGRTFAVLLSERKVASDERRKLLDVFESVCQTMAYAHSRGVIHRDLKPANVMVGAFGEVQVVDWGLAKVLKSGGTADEKRAKQSQISIIETVRSEGSGSGSHSMSGSVMGTPAYMPPEQARGEVEKLDERSDVFSLGAILCEILTGQPPYVGEHERTIEQSAAAKLDDATKRLDDCDADQELVALTKDCLAPAKQARPRSAQVLAQRIHDYLTSVEERARQAQVEAAESRVKAAEERRARKLTVSLAASVLVTVLVAGGGWAWMSSEKARRERDTETQVNAALNEATLNRGEGKWAEALASVERAQGLADSGAASKELHARVAADLAAIERDAELAQENKALARNNAALLNELADVRQPEGDKIYPTDWKRLDASYRDSFARHGLEPDDPDEQVAARALRARGISTELAATLDEWSLVRRAADNPDGSAHLSTVADFVDDDALRKRVRAVVRGRDVGALKAIAGEVDLTALPAPTLRLLGVALLRAGATAEAVGVLRQARLSNPADFVLAMDLGRALTDRGASGAQEVTRHLQAALALRHDSVEAWHELGRSLEEPLHEHERALALFQEAVRHWPQDGHLRFHLGYDLECVGRKDEAVDSYHQAIMLDPQDARALDNLGSLLGSRGQIDESIKYSMLAIEHDPKLANGYFHLANGLAGKHDAGELDEAIENYCIAIDLNPSVAIYRDNAGIAFARKGRPDDAIASHRRAIELDPNLASAYDNLGALLATEGQVDEALANFRRATELDPNLANANVNLGITFYRKGLLDEAISSFSRAIELDPKNAKSHDDLGAALQLKGRFSEAIESFQRAIALDDSVAGTYANLGAAFFKQGRLDMALENYASAVGLDPRNVEYRWSLGNMLREEGQIERACECWRQAIALDENHAPSLNNLAWDLATNPRRELRQPEEAVRLAQHAADFAPQYEGVWNTLGVARYYHDDFTQCIEALQRSIAVHSGGDPIDWLFLAMAEHKLGHSDAARDWYEKSIRWLSRHPVTEELARFLLEAEQTLGADTNAVKQ